MAYVYRYRDTNDGVVKYVGIVNVESNFPKRFEQHKRDKWCKGRNWEISYIEVPSRADAEALEAHYIARYRTYNWYNKAKADWGALSFIDDSKFEWKLIDGTGRDRKKSLMELSTDFLNAQEKIMEVADQIQPGYKNLLQAFWTEYTNLVGTPEVQKYIFEQEQRELLKRTFDNWIKP